MHVTVLLGEGVEWYGHRALIDGIMERVGEDAEAQALIGNYFTRKEWEWHDAMGMWDFSKWSREELAAVHIVVKWMCEHEVEATRGWSPGGVLIFRKEIPGLLTAIERRLAEDEQAGRRG